MKQLYFKTSSEWRLWLQNNHQKETALCLIFFKKNSGKPSMEYEDAVEEALCFGWIDSLVKTIDNQRYSRKFTPRKNNSNWSESNKKRALKLIRQNRMTEMGLAQIEAARRSGRWDKSGRFEIDVHILSEFQTALKQNKKAKENFDRLAPSYQKQFVGWIAAAKRAETRVRRIKEAVEQLEYGRKLGMK